MGHKGHYGQYTGNAKWSKVTSDNMGATKRDDEAHMEYLKEDIDYDNKHGHSDSSMTSDEKHISKLAGDLKYDEKKHGSPAKNVGDPGHKKYFNYGDGKDNDRKKNHMKKIKHNVDGSHSNNTQK
jgi:hypothetical protein